MLHLNKIGTCLGALALASATYGTISFNIAAGTLRDKMGNPITSGLVILAIDTDRDGFELPDATNFLKGDDKEVLRWDFSEGGNIPGEFLSADVVVVDDYATLDWTAGDPLAMFWYPTLDKTATVPGDTTNFGVFADPANEAPGDGWKLPENNTHRHSLQFYAEGSVLNMTSFASEYAAAATLEEGEVFDENADIAGAIVQQGDPKLMQVGWTAVPGIQQYRIERKQPSSDTWKTVGYASGKSAYFDDTSIVAGLSFQYRVVADTGLGPVVLGEATSAAEAARSVFVGIAARGYVDNSAPYTLLNGGIILAGNAPTKRIIGSGIGPHNEFKTGQVGQWVKDPYMTYGLFGQADLGTNDDWIEDFTTQGINPKFAIMSDTMDEKANVTVLRQDPAFAKDAVIIDDLPVDEGVLFKVRTIDDDKGFAAIEVYDAEYAVEDGGPGVSDNRIFSISSRSWYPGNTSISNASITIEGEVPKEVLAIARGPQLTSVGVPSSDALEDPVLRLQGLTGLITTNDDWAVQTAVVDEAAGLLKVETDMARIRAALVENNHDPDQFTKDSVLLVTLLPGSYIFRVVAKEGTREAGSVVIALSEFERE